MRPEEMLGPTPKSGGEPFCCTGACKEEAIRVRDPVTGRFCMPGARSVLLVHYIKKGNYSREALAALRGASTDKKAKPDKKESKKRSRGE